MKVNTNDNGEIIISEFYSGVILQGDANEQIGICCRDGGFEFSYGGSAYRAVNGVISAVGFTSKLTDTDNLASPTIDKRNA
jgi:hypothetical protein